MSDEKNATIETLLRVWDGFGYDNGDVMRDSVRALLDAAYVNGMIEQSQKPKNPMDGSYSVAVSAVRATGLQSPGSSSTS